MAIKINGEEIPENAVRYELSRLVQFYSEYMSGDQIKEQMGLLRQKAEDQAIGAKLLMKDAERLDIAVTKDEEDSKIATMIENAGGQEDFDKMLESQNLTEPMLRDSIARGLKVDKLIEKITEGLSDPSEEEMKEHFEQHAKEYSRPERASAQHILIKADPKKDEEMKAAKTKINELKDKVESGSSFEDLAAEHSACPSGKKAGGSLGWFSKGMMVPEFDKVVFSMEVGALSDAVETQFGVHLIYKTGHEDAGDGSFDDARDTVKDFLRHAKRGELITSYVDELKEKADIQRS